MKKTCGEIFTISPGTPGGPCGAIIHTMSYTVKYLCYSVLVMPLTLVNVWWFSISNVTDISEHLMTRVTHVTGQCFTLSPAEPGGPVRPGRPGTPGIPSAPGRPWKQMNKHYTVLHLDLYTCIACTYLVSLTKKMLCLASVYFLT